MQNYTIPRFVMLFFSTLIVLSQGAFAQKLVNLDDIEILENRIQVPLSESTRSLDIISKAEIMSYPVQSVSELLQYMGGADIRRRGPNGTQADINFRGSTFEQVLVLINGVKIIDPQTSHHVLNLPLDMDIIERIEIIKGPAGRIYGQGAFAGAVNIITKNSKNNSFHAEATFGDFGLFGGKIGGGYQTKKWNHYASYGYEQVEPGYRPFADYMRHQAFLQSEYKMKDGNLQILGSYVHNGFGANSFYASPFDSSSFEQVNTGFLSVKSEHSIGKTTKIRPAIYARYNTDEYTLVREDPSIFQNNHQSLVTGFQVDGSKVLSKNSALGFGVDFRNDRLRSNNLGDRTRNVFTGNLEYKLYLWDEKIKLVPGASLNYYSDFGAYTLYGVDASFSLTENFSVFGNTGTTYRIPSYTELYYEDRSNLGNPDLNPEEAFNYEAGLKYINKVYFLQASYFNRAGTNIIDWVQTPVQVDTMLVDKWKPGNITDLPIQGVDLSAVIQVGKLSFLSPLRTLRFSYTFIDGNAIQLPNETSRYALEHINHQINIASQWIILKTLKFSTGYRFVDRVTMDSYHVWDFGFGVHYKKFRVTAQINNAFNTEYAEFPTVPMPGRWAQFNVRYQWSK